MVVVFKVLIDSSFFMLQDWLYLLIFLFWTIMIK
jgi:hypothetical protein